MDGGASAFYIFSAFAAAAGTAVSVQNQIAANKRRQQILEEELRSNELAALDEENRRLQSLRLANEDMLARSGGIDAFASPSLVAARAFNFEMGMQDIENIRYNISAQRAGISARISLLKSNSRATFRSGILQMGSQVAIGFANASLLKKTTPPKAPPKKSLGGSSGAVGTRAPMTVPEP